MIHVSRTEVAIPRFLILLFAGEPGTFVVPCGALVDVRHRRICEIM